MNRILLSAVLAAAAASPLRADGEGGPLLRSSPPVLGGPLHLDVHSAAGNAVLLAFSSGPGPVRIGPYEVCLTPPFFPIAAGSVPPSGIFRWSVPLPAVPSIAGATVWFQALVSSAGGSVLSSGARVALTDGSAATWANGTTRLPTDPFSDEDVAAADFDLDGDVDFAVVSSGSTGQPPTVALYMNQGGRQGGMPGTFADETAARLPPGFQMRALCVRAGDIDRDGDTDLFAGADDVTGFNAPNVLLINQGGFQGGIPGTFLTDPGFPAGSYETQGAVFADLDRDGFPELVLANGVDRNTAPQPNELLINLSGIGFVIDPAFTTAPFNPPGENDDVVAADFDGDGDKDLFFVRDGQDILLRNDGAFAFTDATADIPALADNSTAAVARDLDRDGDVDLFVANIGTSQLLVNQGRAQGGREGLFLLGTRPSPVPASSIQLAAAAADVDNDGDLDLAVSVHPIAGSELTVLYLNQGGIQGGTEGIFLADPSFAPPSGIIMGLAFGDIEGDGDLDLYLASQGPLGGLPQNALMVNRLVVRP